MTLRALYAKHAREIGATVRAALREHAGNTSHAAKALGIPRTSLLRLIERHDLSAETSGKEGRPRLDPSAAPGESSGS